MTNRGHDFKGYAMLAVLGASLLSFSQQSEQMQMNDDQSKKQKFEAANQDRNRQIADDTTKLLELATQLKAEVDKTSKDTLSLNVIKKADSIEKLAKGVKEKMKLTMAAN